MADDLNTKPKTMDINDLVRELSKSSTSPATPTPSISQTPKPTFPTPKPMIPPQMSSSAPASFMPKPSVPAVSAPPPITPPVLPIQPKQSLGTESRTLDSSSKSSMDLGRIGAKPFIPTPAPVSAKPPMPQPQVTVPPKLVPTLVPPAPLPTPGVKEYKSSIRTMNEDISKIKQGQQPAGIPFPRKVEQVVPVPQPLSPKPAMPSPQFKIPNINLGEIQKTVPMAPLKSVLGVPSILKPSIVPKTEPAPQIYVPPEGQKGVNRNMLFMVIGVVAIVAVAGLSYWFFVLRSPAPEVVIETPTPTPTATPVQDLSSVLAGLESQTFCTAGDCTADSFVYDINNVTINGGQFKKVYLSENDISGTIAEILDSFSVIYPVQLKESLNPESFLLLYGQKEIFDSNGIVKVNTPLEKRLVFVSEVKDSYSTSQVLLGWENTIAGDLQKLLSLNISKQSNPQFLDNTYSGSTIRYKNFLWPDKSIDYGIVTATNGKLYLVLAGSREAMFAIIDKLKGF